jgi:hypothetical protein
MRGYTRDKDAYRGRRVGREAAEVISRLVNS